MGCLRVLFAEDDCVLNMATCEYLHELGIAVTCVHSGSAAIAAIDSLEYLTALLTDIDLGPGPDGFDVARHARQFYPHLPVVFISGTAGMRHAVDGVDGSAFVAKPFQQHQIMQALGRVIRLEAA